MRGDGEELPIEWRGGNPTLEIGSHHESNGPLEENEFHLNEKCVSKIKKLMMFPFDYTILLRCMWAGGLMDNATICTKDAK